MRKKKNLSRLLEPNLKLYFVCMLLFCAAALTVSWTLALVEFMITIGLYVYFRSTSQKRQQSVLRYMDNVADGVDRASRSTLINSPLPIMLCRPDTGELIWSNEHFLQLAGVREHIFETRVEDAVPDFPTQWLLEGKLMCPERVVLNGRKFQVYGSLTRAKGHNGEQSLVSTTYWIDMTESDKLKEKYLASRPVVSVLNIDNYDELMKACPDTRRSAVLAQIDEKINSWASSVNGLLVKTDRDHYLLVFEEQHYGHFLEDKFSVLDTIREICVGKDVHPTLSIGMGMDADSLAELYKRASLCVEMALSRGGDQAVIRGKGDFAFYGGRAKSTEKRTKVKSRVMANALRELMDDADEIYIMGHSFADMDAVGAAAGLCCAARQLGKTAQIVINREKNSAQALISRLLTAPEYKNVFADPQDVFVRMKSGALLIVVDTTRPEMVESRQILEACNHVAVIDHHRRAATYIEHAAFSFHEPYASSASELVTELLQYLAEPSDLLRVEAEALLAGIVLDTKRFSLRTGGRTFEAAAFLRRAGADTTDVQRLFQSNLQEMVSKYDIIRRAELYRTHMAISVCPEEVDRVAAAQAADELLGLKGVQASFVLYQNQDDVLLSARSLGDVNVQMILEVLGGGGNSTTAGGRVPNTATAPVEENLKAAIDAYLDQ